MESKSKWSPVCLVYHRVVSLDHVVVFLHIHNDIMFDIRF